MSSCFPSSRCQSKWRSVCRYFYCWSHCNHWQSHQLYTDTFIWQVWWAGLWCWPWVGKRVVWGGRHVSWCLGLLPVSLPKPDYKSPENCPVRAIRSLSWPWLLWGLSASRRCTFFTGSGLWFTIKAFVEDPPHSFGLLETILAKTKCYWGGRWIPPCWHQLRTLCAFTEMRCLWLSLLTLLMVCFQCLWFLFVCLLLCRLPPGMSKVQCTTLSKVAIDI